MTEYGERRLRQTLDQIQTRLSQADAVAKHDPLALGRQIGYLKASLVTAEMDIAAILRYEAQWGNKDEPGTSPEEIEEAIEEATAATVAV